MSKTINNLIDELNSVKVETLKFSTPLKQEQKRQLKVKLDNDYGAKLTEAEGWEQANRQLVDYKENNR